MSKYLCTELSAQYLQALFLKSKRVNAMSKMIKSRLRFANFSEDFKEALDAKKSLMNYCKRHENITFNFSEHIFKLYYSNFSKMSKVGPGLQK